MENRWTPTQKQKEMVMPLINEFADKIKQNSNAEKCIDFYNKGISPTQLLDILVEDMGFERKDFDSNGWEFDFWITVSKDGVDYVIAGTGMTFELIFRLA